MPSFMTCLRSCRCYGFRRYGRSLFEATPMLTRWDAAKHSPVPTADDHSIRERGPNEKLLAVASFEVRREKVSLM